MTIRQQGGVFGRNPAFNDVKAETIEVTDIYLPDGGEASFGASNDLKIYHDGSASYISETGTGNLFIDGGNLRLRNADGSKVFLLANSGDKTDIYFDGAAKIRTESTGAKILGNLSFDAGNGIDFSATSGTGTSELFDDYEEGTFTPVIADAATGGNTGTASQAYGYYTKVGRNVTIHLNMTDINTTGLTAGNDVYIQGLPFTSLAVTGSIAYNGSIWGALINLDATTPYLVPVIGDGQAAIFLKEWGDNTGTDNLMVSELTSGASDLNISLSYFAA